eukprot:COSAG02_NODE_59829_length_273_cov_0.591954_1_plen_36_part_01
MGSLFLSFVGKEKPRRPSGDEAPGRRQVTPSKFCVE